MSEGVAISPDHRDALYSMILTGLDEFLDLEQATKTEDLERCNRIGRRLHDALRLVVEGGLGWGRRYPPEKISLTLAPGELRRILTGLRQDAVSLHDAIYPEYEEKRGELDEVALARDACDEALRQLREGRR